MLSNKKIVPHSGDPSSGYAAFRMTCWGDTTKQAITQYLGEVRTCSIGYFHGIGPDNPQFFWNIQKKSGGDSFLSAGCHALDGALFFMDGEVASVYSVSTHQPHTNYAQYEYDPIQSITIHFKDGRFATVTSNIAHHVK